MSWSELSGTGTFGDYRPRDWLSRYGLGGAAQPDSWFDGGESGYSDLDPMAVSSGAEKMAIFYQRALAQQVFWATGGLSHEIAPQ